MAVTDREVAIHAASDAEMTARRDLAAAHRLVAVYGWTNLIYNHIVLRVPGEPDHFLIKREELLFEEITASNLVKLDMSGKRSGDPSAKVSPGYTIHAAVLQARPEINCVIHVHTEAGMAMSAHKGGLLPITQDAMHFYNRIGYTAYDGFSTPENQRAALARDLGQNWALILRNHGLVTCAENVPVALLLMRYLISSCQTQLMLEASGAEILIPSPEACEDVASRWERIYQKSKAADEWAAMLRSLEPAHADYRN
jgi:ribulose-5-phosphate 4-epimerase/fuculose-1-phosphate aldolase